jgi:hypothetical protein
MRVTLKLEIEVEVENLLPLLDLPSLTSQTSRDELEMEVRCAVREYVFDNAERVGEVDYEGVENADFTDLYHEVRDLISDTENQADNLEEEDEVA